MDFKIEIIGLSAFLENLAEAPEIVAPAIQGSIEDSIDILASHTIKGTVPFRTGNLIQSFRKELTAFNGTWGPTASYAADVEFGTAPHVILPKSIGWPGHKGGLKTPYGIFNRINHPGSKANQYMERIISQSQSEINTSFGNALEKIIKAIAGQ